MSATPANALIINPIFDTSITSLANAAQVESAFRTAAAVFTNALTSPVTINIQVSWGSVAGHALPGSDIAASVDPVYDGLAYSDVQSYFTGSASVNPQDPQFAAVAAALPLNQPPGLSNYVVPYAEAKALGLSAGDGMGFDGSVGFNAKTNWDFSPIGGIAAGAYDFQGLALHEIEEVLGRLSGLTSSRPQFRTFFDLFRYNGVGKLAFSFTSPAYLSLDAGLTNLGNFNYTGGGDRSDWTTGSGMMSDAQLAYLPSGKVLTLGSADWAALGAMGWNQTNTPWFIFLPSGVGTAPDIGDSATRAPEPATWSLMLAGFGLAGAGIRRRSSAASA